MGAYETGVLLAVAVLVGVLVLVRVLDLVGVLVLVRVLDLVRVLVLVRVLDLVGVLLRVGVFVAVRVLVAVAGGVFDAVGVGVTVDAATDKPRLIAMRFSPISFDSSPTYITLSAANLSVFSPQQTMSALLRSAHAKPLPAFTAKTVLSVPTST